MATLAAIETVLKRAGVEIIDENGGGPGVRLRARRQHTDILRSTSECSFGKTALKRGSQIHPAVKHGGYSRTTLLPGEDTVAFEKLHNDLVAEFAPVGPLEEDIVASMARFVWRKQNLSTYRLAEKARDRISAINSMLGPLLDFPFAFFI